MAHICTHLEQEAEPFATVSVTGNLVTFQLHNVKDGVSVRRGGGKRGKVTEFSRQSRWRLLKTLAKVDWGRTRLVTLTYPDWVSRETLAANQYHIRAFVERWVRHYGYRPSFVWRKEYTARGVVHFHLLQPQAKWHDDLIRFVSKSWDEILAVDREGSVEKAGTKVEFARTRKKAMSYVAKYIAKSSAPFPDYHCGRIWGWVGREGFKECRTNTYIVPVEAFFVEKEELENRVGHHVYARKLDRLIKWW